MNSTKPPESTTLQYGKQPDFNASSSYDCMHVVAVALKRVLDSGDPITGETARLALETSTFSGATGLTKFDPNGDVTGKAFGRRVIQAGKAAPTNCLLNHPQCHE